MRYNPNLQYPAIKTGGVFCFSVVGGILILIRPGSRVLRSIRLGVILFNPAGLTQPERKLQISRCIMTAIELIDRARTLSWQYRTRVVVVLDLFTRSLRTFIAPHADYIESKPVRYITIKTYRNGEPE